MEDLMMQHATIPKHTIGSTLSDLFSVSLEYGCKVAEQLPDNAQLNGGHDNVKPRTTHRAKANARIERNFFEGRT